MAIVLPWHLEDKTLSRRVAVDIAARLGVELGHFVRSESIDDRLRDDGSDANKKARRQSDG